MKTENKTTVTLTKLEWVKDAEGKHLYDEHALQKFYASEKRKMEAQNRKIAGSSKLQRSYSICDPDQYAAMMCEMYKHHFRLTNPKLISLT